MTTPWYIYSFLASLSFTGMVLCVRYLGNKGFSAKQILLFLFGFGLLGFILLNPGEILSITQKDQFPLFFQIMFIVGVVAVIGNLADFKATILAPNPGFVGVIKNSNVLLVALFSVLFFQSPLSWIKALGMLIIILGIATIIVEKKATSISQDTASPTWIKLAALNAICFAIAVLCIKKAVSLDFSSFQINFFVFAFNFLAFVVMNKNEHEFGYGMLNGQPNANDLLIYQKLPRNSVKRIIIFTDGLIPWYGTKNMSHDQIAWGIRNAYCKGGLEEILAEVRALEETTANQGHVTHGEATAIAIEL